MNTWIKKNLWIITLFVLCLAGLVWLAYYGVTSEPTVVEPVYEWCDKKISHTWDMLAVASCKLREAKQVKDNLISIHNEKIEVVDKVIIENREFIQKNKDSGIDYKKDMGK